MENIPLALPALFILATLLVLWMFYRAARNSKIVLAIIFVWLALQGIIAVTGFYTATNGVPPRFALLPGIPVVSIIILFLTKKGRVFIDSLDIKWLTIIHVIRIPVEITLLWLFLQKAIPGIMTFEGRNFDLLSGISAPVIYYFCFINPRFNARVLLVWNIICLLLLINIVMIAILSAPFSFQKFGFDQPNIALLYFPFVWLPCFIVPVVLLSHLVSIRRLINYKDVVVKYNLNYKQPPVAKN